MDALSLTMIGAMYENGGNTVHRLLDGHPDLFVYPFESQLGTRLVNDHLTSVFPAKYRWPLFRLGATNEEDYDAIIDEECRVRANTPHVSKFRHASFDFSDQERRARFVELTGHGTRSRPRNVEAFFRATLMAWHDSHQPSDPAMYVGYSPVMTVDSVTILDEMPLAHFIHVVRNPWSSYAETKHRPVPLTMAHYLFGWVACQHAALQAAQVHPSRFQIVRFEDVIANPVGALAPICGHWGLRSSPTLATPSWNGTVLTEVYPWGTIRTPTPEQNRATAAELSSAEIAAVRRYAAPLLGLFGYQDFPGA